MNWPIVAATPDPVDVPDDPPSETVFVAGPGPHWLPAVPRQAKPVSNGPSAGHRSRQRLDPPVKLKTHGQSSGCDSAATQTPSRPGLGKAPPQPAECFLLVSTLIGNAQRGWGEKGVPFHFFGGWLSHNPRAQHVAAQQLAEQEGQGPRAAPLLAAPQDPSRIWDETPEDPAQVHLLRRTLHPLPNHFLLVSSFHFPHCPRCILFLFFLRLGDFLNKIIVRKRWPFQYPLVSSRTLSDQRALSQRFRAPNSTR